jgi:hypothetical protein
MGDSQLVAKQM